MLPQLSGAAKLMPGTDYNLTQQAVESEHGSAHQASSSVVWLVLFFIVIFLSILGNTVYMASLLCRRSLTLTHFIISFFFLINLIEYGLIIFEFSLDLGSQFSHSEVSCKFYQVLLQGSPLLNAGAVILLVFHAYLTSYNGHHPPTHILMRIFIALFIIAGILLSIPSILFSKIAFNTSQAPMCVMDFSSLDILTGMDEGRQDTVSAIFFLFYKSVLTYWLPFALVILPIIKMLKMVDTLADKQFTISLTLGVSISFLVFNLPLASIVLARQLITILYIPVSSITAWSIHVLHSLFLLISFFFHIFRPVVCLVLDQDNFQRLSIKRYIQVDGDEQV